MAIAFATLILTPFPPPQPTPHFSSLQFHGRAPLCRPRLSRPPRHRSHTFPTVGSRQNRRIFSSFDGIKVAASVTREPMIPPYNVLITGSTKGIGYALAKEFRRAGDNVIISSRSAERVESALQSLRREFGEHVWGTKCDVRIGKDVKDLVTFAQANLKYIDIWVLNSTFYLRRLGMMIDDDNINQGEMTTLDDDQCYTTMMLMIAAKKRKVNNAGSNAYSYKPLAEASDEDLIEVVTTNTLGLMICCREAIKMMLKQPRGGHIFNIDGAGSDGRPTPRFAAYGATKRSVVHLTKSLQAELQMQDVKNVIVHNLSPGMVTTELLMSGANTKQAKFFINVLAEPAEVSAFEGAALADAVAVVTWRRTRPQSGQPPLWLSSSAGVPIMHEWILVDHAIIFIVHQEVLAGQASWSLSCNPNFLAQPLEIVGQLPSLLVFFCL